MKRKAIPVLALCSLTILNTAGCLVAADIPYGGVYGAPMGYGYEPLLYNGAVVYYTNYGVPYYWLGGSQVWLPAPVRPRYVEHWRAHRPAYNAWYAQRGQYYQNRPYAGGGGYRSGPVGGPAVTPYRQPQTWQHQRPGISQPYPQGQSQGWRGQGWQGQAQPQVRPQQGGYLGAQRQPGYQPWQQGRTRAQPGQAPYQSGQQQGRVPVQQGQVPTPAGPQQGQAPVQQNQGPTSPWRQQGRAPVQQNQGPTPPWQRQDQASAPQQTPYQGRGHFGRGSGQQGQGQDQGQSRPHRDRSQSIP